MLGLEISIITAKFKTKAEEPQISRFFSKLLAPSPYDCWALARHPICNGRGLIRLAGTEPHAARASNSRNFIVTAARTT